MKKIIAFDLSSGDYGITVSLPAANSFLAENPDYKIIAFIHKDDKIPAQHHKNIEFHVCNDKIAQDDGPLQVKRKSDSTLVRAIEKVINAEADFVVSAAASGPLVIAGYLFSKPILPGLKPAFSPIALNEDYKPKILLDAGANLDANAETILTYAIMGSEYIKALQISDKPRVRLLNIGSEPIKGSKLMLDAYKKLSESKKINFLGNLEGTEVLSNKDDVVVADALSGNIAVKSYEGAFNLVYQTIKKTARESFWVKLLLFMMPELRRNLRKIMSADEVGGALILGLNHLLIKSHGGSNEKYLFNSLNLGKKLSENNLIEKIKEVLNED